MANVDGGSVLEVKRVSGDGNVPVNIPFQPWSVRRDLDDGFSALNVRACVPDMGSLQSAGARFIPDSLRRIWPGQH